jgi:PAS domain S-box-containing protein
VANEPSERESDRLLNDLRLTELFGSAPGLIFFAWDPQTDMIVRYGDVFGFIGFHPDEMEPTNDWWMQRIHSDDRDRVRAELDAAVAEQDRYSIECRVIHRSGNILQTWINGVILRDESGRPIQVVGTSVDMTRRRELEAQLVRREREVTALVDHTPDAVFRFDRDDECVYASSVVQEFFGIRPDEAIGKKTAELIAVGYGLPSKWSDQIRRVFETGDAAVHTGVIETPEAPRYIHTRMAPEIDESGAVECVLVVVHDVSDLQEARAAIEAGDSRLRVALAKRPVMVYEQDATLRYTWVVNPESGPVPGAAVGVRDSDLLSGDEKDELESIKMQVIQSGKPFHGEYQTTIDDATRYFWINADPVFDRSGTVIGIIGAAIDVTAPGEMERPAPPARPGAPFCAHRRTGGCLDLGRGYRSARFQ